MPLPEAAEIFGRLVVVLGMVAGIEVGLAFLMRINREAGERYDD